MPAKKASADGLALALPEGDETLRIVLQGVLAGEMAVCGEELETGDLAGELYWMRFDVGPRYVELGLRIGAAAKALRTVLDLEQSEVRVRMTPEHLQTRLKDVAQGAHEHLDSLKGDEKHRGVDVALRAEALLEHLGEQVAA
jgi:hypothetical protein